MDPLPFGLSRETQIRRDARGRWFDGVVEIEHPRIREAFDRWIERAEDGRYILKNATHWAYVAIEGPPVWVRRAKPLGVGVELELSDGRTEALDPTTLRQDLEGRLYATVRGGQMPAGFTRQAGADLMDLLEEDGEQIVLVLGAARIPIEVRAAPLELPGG